jgi:sulfate permease, SulP family
MELQLLHPSQLDGSNKETRASLPSLAAQGEGAYRGESGKSSSPRPIGSSKVSVSGVRHRSGSIEGETRLGSVRTFRRVPIEKIRTVVTSSGDTSAEGDSDDYDKPRSMKDTVASYFDLKLTTVPIMDWLPVYTFADFKLDAMAGLQGFIFLIPGALTTSFIAGVPPTIGLYSSIFPPFFYAIVGTSNHLTVGPASLSCLLLAKLAQPYGYPENSPEYVAIVLCASMLVGIITYILGTLNLGVLANFLSSTVLKGFISGAALVICLSQVKYLFGIKLPKLTYSHEIIIYILSHLNETNPSAILLGLATIAVLYGVKQWKLMYKPTLERNKQLWYQVASALATFSTLILIAIGGAIAYQITKSGGDIAVIGTIPPGIHLVQFSFLSFSDTLSLVPSASVIAVVVFAQNWSIAKKFAMQKGYKVDATQELLAGGLTNIFGPLLSSIVVAGGLGRSTISADLNAKTQMAACIASLMALVAVLFLTPVFYYIPMTVLSGVIQVTVSSMCDFTAMRQAHAIDPKDCAVMVVTFLCTFFVGITEGIFLGVVFSIATIMNSSAFPRMTHLGRLPDGHFRDVTRFRNARQIECIGIFRMDASLYFANCEAFKETVHDVAAGAYHTSQAHICLVILDVSAWIDIDMSGIQVIEEIHAELIREGVQIAFVAANGYVRSRLKKVKFMDSALLNHFMFDTIHEAIEALEERRQNIPLEIEKADPDLIEADLSPPRMRSLSQPEAYLPVSTMNPMHVDETTLEAQGSESDLRAPSASQDEGDGSIAVRVASHVPFVAQDQV